MPTPQERVTGAMRFFFEQALPQAAGKTFSQLSDPLVHLGRYVRHTGGEVPTSLGQGLTPAYALQVSAALPAAGGNPNPAGVEVAAGAPARHILWVRHAADAAVDSEEEIQRVMADLDTFVGLFDGPQAGEAATPATPQPAGAGAGAPAGTAGTAGATGGETAARTAAARAADWARGIVASRAALGVNLSTLTAVPAGLRELAADLPALKQVLQHFFTYTTDGTYYRRWAGAGRDAGNAAHLTPEYKRENIREVRLERERTYLYMVVPASLLSSGGSLEPGVFREAVVRFDETGDEQRPYTLSTVHTVRWRRSTAPHEDFVFFYSTEGTGLPVAREVRDKMSSRLQSFLSGYLAKPEAERAAYLQESQIATPGGNGAAPQVFLLAEVEGTPAMPQGVMATGSDGVLTLLVPPDKILEVAALPAVKKLSSMPVMHPSLDQARTMVQYPALNNRIAAGSRGGKGVVVGIIDSGIDGSHPAFAGRLAAYWDQGTVPATAGSTPASRHTADADYATFNWGTELMGTTETATARDTNGHGTHVAGIAAGAEVKDAAGNVICPAGLAPQATIVGVRTIGVAGGNVNLALQYIFKKAQELSLPCVVNMSFGHSDHAHDGSALNSRQLFTQVRTSTGAYRPGRILVGAAGNERGTRTHVSRSLAATSGTNPGVLTIPVRIGAQSPATTPYRQEDVILWVKPPAGGFPFALDLWVYRQANPLANTAVVRLGNTVTPAGTFPGLQMRIDVFSQLMDPVNLDHPFRVRFTDTNPGNTVLPADTWVIMMINRTALPLEVHAWIPAGWRGCSVFGGAAQADDDAFLVGAPSDSPGIISVASVTSRTSWRPHGAAADLSVGGTVREISDFSSPGPLRPSTRTIQQIYGLGATDEVRAVDVTAPGNRLQAAATSHRSTPFSANDIVTKDAAGVGRSVMMQGTSMASPVVTGIVANLLAVKPNLTTLEVLDRLKRCSAVPATSTFQPPAAPAGTKPWSRDWGYGLLDGTTLDLT